MEVIPPLAGHELLLVLAQFTVLLLVARALGELAGRFGWPPVVGELLAGFVLGPTLLGNLAPPLFEALFPQTAEQMHLIEVVSWLGVIMLLVLTGLETDTELIVRKGKGAAAISLGGIVVPFATGLALGFFLPEQFIARPDQRLVFALFIGTAMSISAIPVIAKVLMEMNVVRRDIGQITLAAGMIDDTMGWVLLSVVAGLASSGTVSPGTAAQAILSVVAVFGLAFTVGRRFVRWLVRVLDNTVGGDMIKITALMALALAFGTITQLLHLEAVLGAFIAGILVGEVRRFDHRLRHIFEQLTLGVFAPVFFALAGIRVNLAALLDPTVALAAAVVLAVAILGKFVGAYLGARASRLGTWEALALGSGMNARGAIEIIVATIGLSLGILTPDMYAIILMISIVTSLMAPPLLRWTLRRVEFSEEEKERLEAEERRRESFVGNLKRILLPTRGGTNSQIAAQLVGLMVGREDIEVTGMYVRSASNGDAGAATDEEVRARLQRIGSHLEPLEDHNVRSVVREAEDGASGVVLGEAERGYDLLVIGASERLVEGEGTLFTRFVDDVIQESPCPLLVVSARGAEDVDRDADPLSLGHILLPVSGSDYDRPAAEAAFSIARDREIVVDIVHVVSGPQHATRVGGEEAVTHAVELGEDLVNQIAELGHAMGATVHTDVLVADHPEHAIVERAERRADLVVLASNRRPVTQRAFFGHRIDHVLRHASCPVAVVSAT
ncbi:MAG: cation:proton antiporter [Actinomycetota bacterium]|nr:cation:proton antiporter [Actinomycetota bacterium]